MHLKNRRKPPRSDEEPRRFFVAAAAKLGQEAPFLLQHVGPHELHVISDAEFLRILEEVSPASRTLQAARWKQCNSCFGNDVGKHKTFNQKIDMVLRPGREPILI